VKLLRLTIKGLRSFTQETSVDLERLGEQGLFAIVGPTGAGKSTVLDGIFLALFGRSPRGEAGECVSAGALALAVRLEIGVEREGQPARLAVERRFRWSKKREAGEASLGAELRGAPRHLPLRIEEPRDGGWAAVDLGGRKAEEYLREEIVRVSLADFQQAVVLPQGEIDALLRARPAERRTLVASLFRTEHLGQPLFEELRARELGVRGEITRLDEAEREQQVGAEEEAEATRLADEAAAEAERCAAALKEAEIAAQSQRLGRQRCAARDAAEESLALAERRLVERADDRARLAQGERAAQVDAALLDLARARGLALEALLAALDAGPVESDEAVAAMEARLPTLRVGEEERAEALGALSLAELGAAELRAERALDDEREARAARIEALGQQQARMNLRIEESAREVEEAGAALAEAEATLALALAAHEAAALELAEAQARAAAALIAASLREGDPCPVCGSADHPGVDHRAAADAVARETQALALAAREAATARRDRDGAARTRALAEQGARAEEAKRASIQGEIDAARLALARLLSGDERPRALRDAEAEVARHRARAELSLSALPPAVREHLRAAQGARSLTDAEARARALSERAREAEQLERRLAQARERASALRAATRLGFATLAAYRDARLSPRALAALAADLDALTRERDRLAAVRDERRRDAQREVSEAEAQHAERARDEAASHAGEARAQAAQAAFHCDELARRKERALAFQARAALLGPRARRLALLQKTVAGNQLSELAAERHLEAVTRGAAALLRTLSADRYALVRSAEGAFAVSDAAHAGLIRAPSTLSGGETFLVSLSLALALSERIQLAGRTRFDFFFLDEGFGALDARTLEIALSALERLRGSRRVIGMISHVATIEERVPRTLHVEPARPGGSAKVRQETR
jgi:exonuclease SbcC